MFARTLRTAVVVYGTTNAVYGTTNADAGVGIGLKKGVFGNLGKKAIN